MRRQGGERAEEVCAGVTGARLPRVAATYYLNSAPLVWSFAQGERRRAVRLLSDAAPVRCARMLARGEADAALAPVIEYQRAARLRLVPGVCVGAKREVRSVLLVTRGMPLKEARRVALDTTSSTSAALTRVIFREFFGHEPEFEACAPDLSQMLGRADAALVIGDPAMTFAREGLRVYDLAALWREHTGLGFVFAMWMTREGAGEAAGRVDFAAARDEGVAHLEEIAAQYEGDLGLARAELLSYLRENICFELDEELVAGLKLFYKLAHRHSITETLRPLWTTTGAPIA
ncbi:MAG TPA: menaquinone biosynthesis protein [Pyrinomonadaceae bacterium]|nr:menaquinone biosynthesis protein [Pyrinomonadaceae bacterium]